MKHTLYSYSSQQHQLDIIIVGVKAIYQLTPNVLSVEKLVGQANALLE